MNMINDGRFRGVLGWSADGESFSILKRAAFKARVLPAYFGSIQLKSFKKRLSRHGFETRQIYTLDREDTAFFHPNFITDRPELCVLIVPLGTTKTSTKRVREEVENQPSSKPSSSFSDGNSLQAYQGPASPPAITATTSATEIPPRGQAQTKAPTVEVSVAAASLCAVSRQTITEAPTDQKSWGEPSAKRIRDTNDAITHDASMGMQYADIEASHGIATTGSNSASSAAMGSDSTLMEIVNVVPSEQVEVIRSRNENKEEEREEHKLTVTLTEGTPIQAASPQDDVFPEIGTPTQVSSAFPTSFPDVKRTSRSQGEECNLMPQDEQAAVESSVHDSGKDESQHMFEDGDAETGRVQEEQRNERRIEKTERHADSCGGIHPNDEKGGSAEAPSETLDHQDLGRVLFSTIYSSSAGINATFLQTIQQQWLQSEIQAAAMSAQAAFFRKLFLQICTTHGGSTDLLQQQQQVALGSVRTEEGFLNGFKQQAVNLDGPSVFPDDSGEKREDGSCNLRQQTPLGHSGITVDQMSFAQDPVAVELQMASSLGLKFSSSTQVWPEEKCQGSSSQSNHHKD